MRLIFFVLMFAFFSSNAQEDYHIVPEPAEVKAGNGKFMLSPSTEIVLEGSGLEKTAKYFNDYLKKYYGFTLKTVVKKVNTNLITLNFERLDNPQQGGYTLNIHPNEIYIGGMMKPGFFTEFKR